MPLNFLVDKVSVDELTREIVLKTILTHPALFQKLTFFLVTLSPRPLVNCES